MASPYPSLTFTKPRFLRCPHQWLLQSVPMAISLSNFSSLIQIIRSGDSPFAFLINRPIHFFEADDLQIFKNLGKSGNSTVKSGGGHANFAALPSDLITPIFFHTQT